MSLELVKKLRNITQAGFIDCKKALKESNNDLDKAIEILRKKGIAKASKKSGNETTEGTIVSYIHAGNTMGVLLHLACQTDFVGKNEKFVKLAEEIALHIAASNPEYISKENVPEEKIEKEKEILIAQMGDISKKPKEIQEKIISGKLEKFFSETCLMNQKYVKDDSKTIEDLIKEYIAKFGENIIIQRFVRFSVK